MRSQLLLVTLSVFALAVYSPGQQTTQPTNLPTVKVRFSVTDALGRAVNDLKAEDIQVFDGDSPVTVSSLSQETTPLIYGLLIDRSGSLKLHFANMLEVAKQVIVANNADDQAFLMTFVDHDKLEMMQELTTDKTALLNGLNRLRVEGGQTALVDAVYVSAQYAMKHLPSTNSRVALVLLSDCEERVSYYREEQLMELLRKSKIQVFVVALVSDLDPETGLLRRSPRQKATDLATRLARESGGSVFISKSPKDLEDATTTLTTALHSRYLAEYKPSKNADKLKRNVQIKLTKSPEHEKWRVVVGNVITEATK